MQLTNVEPDRDGSGFAFLIRNSTPEDANRLSNAVAESGLYGQVTWTPALEQAGLKVMGPRAALEKIHALFREGG
jgi:hypothetical protein